MSAEAEKDTPASQGAPPSDARRPKKSIVLGGGTLAVIALGWAASLLAVPHKPKEDEHSTRSSFLLDISPPGGFQVNLSGMAGKHYLAMDATIEVDAFEEARASERAADELCRAKLSDAVLATASRKTKDDLDDPMGKEAFREELRLVLEQVLFPVQVGATDGKGSPHAESGLAPGLSIDRSTLRGSFFGHAVDLDAAKKTIRLDGGPLVRFEGGETDLAVCNQDGDCIFVDVSHLDPAFQGEVQVGVLGWIRRVFFTSFLMQ
jgi:flagellar basal body-associated protein FliL